MEETKRLTMQEAFTLVVRGLRNQGWRKAALGGDWTTGACQFRLRNGLCCAIGQLIPAEKYGSYLEGNGPRHVLEEVGVQVEGDWILDKLLDAHDQAMDRLDMHRRFRELAEKHGLEFPADCLAPEIESGAV